MIALRTDASAADRAVSEAQSLAQIMLKSHSVQKRASPDHTIRWEFRDFPSDVGHDIDRLGHDQQNSVACQFGNGRNDFFKNIQSVFDVWSFSRNSFADSNYYDRGITDHRYVWNNDVFFLSFFDVNIFFEQKTFSGSSKKTDKDIEARS